VEAPDESSIIAGCVKLGLIDVNDVVGPFTVE